VTTQKGAGQASGEDDQYAESLLKTTLAILDGKVGFPN